jgi:dienelactone hydrolase
MLARIVRLAPAVALLVALGCAPPNAATPYPAAEPPDAGRTEPPAPAESEVSKVDGIARYFEREVDLEPFLAGFPYGRFRPSLETGKLFFYELGSEYTLRMLDVPTANEPWDLAKARALGDTDWSKRSLWSIHHHAGSNHLWLHADEKNDEEMNLWTLDLDSGELEQITKYDYVYGFGFNEDESTVAYLARHGKKAPFRTCLMARGVESGREERVVCDDETDLSFTWSDIVFSPDGRQVFFNAQIEGDRTRVQLVRVDLFARRRFPLPVTDTARKRNSPTVIDRFVGDDLLFIANDDGFDNVYAFSLADQKVRQLTRFTEDTTSAALTDAGVVAVHQTPAGATLVLIDPRSGNVLEQRQLPGNVRVMDGHGTRAVFQQESPDIVFEAWTVDTSKKKLDAHRVVEVDPGLQEKIVACTATAVKIPTFDIDPKTKKTRELHAFLLEPRHPPDDPSHALAMITAFYGGSNAYRTFDQIMCAAGLTVVSPAVRGSSGFGREFYALNDKDLGGDEIVDLFHVARWLETRTGLDARRIGVYGGSHGGYATMRALTFQPETNARNDFYAFGFGLSHAGFSDIKTFYDATNIPDWVVLESGDPDDPKDLAKMKARSPLEQVERLRAPLLVTHGSKDWRVPVDESRQFVRAAKALGLPVQYVEVEGQGHSIEGLDLQVKVYQARFDFLKAVAKAAPTDSGGATEPAKALESGS